MARLHLEVMRQLVDEIVDGVRAPDEPLPHEAALAEQYGVSRGTTRAALLALELRGLIRIRHGKRALVLDAGHWNVLDEEVAGRMLTTPRHREAILQALELHRLVACYAVEAAAKRAEPEQLPRLRDMVRRMAGAAERASRSATAADRYREERLTFHRTVARMSGTGALAAFVGRLHGTLARAEDGTLYDPDALGPELHEHVQLLAAIDERSPARAAAAMDRYLRLVIARYRRR